MQFQFLRLTQIWKIRNEITKLFSHFPLELWMYHTPLTWYEQENLGYKAYFEALPRALWFLRLFTLWVGSQRHCPSVLQASTRVHKTHNSAPLSSLSSLSSCIYRHKRNVLLLKNVAWYILPVASSCNCSTELIS